MSELIEKQVIIDWLKYKWNRSADSLFYGIQELPTTDIDLSGYSDKLWKLAYDRGYEKCRQDAIELAMQYCPDDDGTCSKADEDIRILLDELEDLPSAQPERTCVNCGRTANNGGWYADGGTRCPIEEHYALPKDGYCHLWEKRSVTDDDYPERRTDE